MTHLAYRRLLTRLLLSALLAGAIVPSARAQTSSPAAPASVARPAADAKPSADGAAKDPAAASIAATTPPPAVPTPPAAPAPSPCLDHRTADCLLEQAIAQRLAAGTPLKFGQANAAQPDDRLARDVIDTGQPKLAAKLADAMPDDAAPSRTGLLYAAHRDADAAREPPETQGDAVWAILQRGDLPAALTAASHLSVPPVKAGDATDADDKDRLCVLPPDAYPNAVAALSAAFLMKNDGGDALQAAQDLRLDQLSKKFNPSSCLGKATRSAYLDSMAGLFATTKAQRRALRKKVAAEYQTGLQDFGIAATGRGLGDAARSLAAHNQAAEIALLLPLARATVTVKRDVEAKAELVGLDDEALILALTGKYPAAVQRIEALGKPPTEKSFVQNLQGDGNAPDNADLQVASFLAIAHYADQAGDTKSLNLTLDHLAPYLGKRTGAGVRDKNQVQLDDATDELSFAELSFDASRPGPDIDKAVAKAFDICNSLNQFPQDLIRQAVGFALKRDNYATALTLDENYDSDVRTTYLILDYFVRRSLWSEYDKLLAKPGVIDKLSGAAQAPGIASALTEAKQWDRYAKFIQTLKDGIGKDAAVTDLTARTYLPAVRAPDDIFKTAWQQKMDACDKRDAPTPAEKQEACYLDIDEALP